MLKVLGKESLIYGIGQVANQAISIFILPIVTRAFSVQEVGLIDLLTVVQTLGFILSTMGVDTALTFYYWDAKGRPERQTHHVSTAFFSQLLFSVFIVAGLVLLKQPLEQIYFKKEISRLYYLCILNVPFLVVFNFFGKLCRIYRRPILFNVITILNLLLYVLSLTILLFRLKLGLEAVFIGRLLSFAAVIVASLWIFRRDLFSGARPGMLLEQLKYGAPLIPFLVVDWVLRAADRFFLSSYWGSREIGLYSVATKIAMAVGLIIGAFNLAWGPFSMSIKDRPNARETYGRVLSYFLAFVLGTILMLQLVSPLLVLLLSTREYLAVADLVPLLALGLALKGTYGILAVGLNVLKKTYYITVGTLIAAGVNILMNRLLVPLYASWGAALAGCVGYFLSSVSIYVIGNRFFKIRYNFAQLLLIVGLFLVAFGQHYVLKYLLKADTPIQVGTGILFVAIYGFALFKLKLIRTNLASYFQR